MRAQMTANAYSEQMDLPSPELSSVALRLPAEAIALPQARALARGRTLDAGDDATTLIAGALDWCDAATVTHQHRVGAIGMAIAGEMGLPRKRARLIGFAGLVHDIGEGLVRRERSGGNGEFTAEDIALEQAHVRLGYNVLRSFGFPWPIAATVLQHHERFDGSGYPKGLKGEEILLDARIIAVADIIEVLACEQGSDCTERGFAAALVEIEARKGQYYDAAVVEAALRLFREKGYTF